MSSRSPSTKPSTPTASLHACSLGDSLVLAFKGASTSSAETTGVSSCTASCQSWRRSVIPCRRALRLYVQSRSASRMTSLMEAYSPVATALRTMATISGGKTMLIFRRWSWAPPSTNPSSNHACSAAYSRAVGKTRGSARSCGRVASQPRQASHMERGMALCAVR
jgi:hypothetical protein